MGGSVAQWSEPWNYNQQVMGSVPGRRDFCATLDKLFTHMCPCHQAVQFGVSQ